MGPKGVYPLHPTAEWKNKTSSTKSRFNVENFFRNKIYNKHIKLALVLPLIELREKILCVKKINVIFIVSIMKMPKIILVKMRK